MSARRALARAALRWVVPRELRDEIEGDLREEHAALRRSVGSGAADRWLLRAALGLCVSLLWARTPFARSASLRTPPLPARRRGLPVSITDLKLAVRLVLKQPVVAATSILALAVAMSLSITGFTVMHAVLFAELPLPGGEDFVYLKLHDRETLRQVSSPVPAFDAWVGSTQTLAAVGGFRTRWANLEPAAGEPVQVRVADITPAGLRATGVRPLHGRLLADGDARTGAAPVVLLRADLWRDHLGGDPAAIGNPVRIGGDSYTLAGVLPTAFAFPESQSVWFPLDPLGAGDELHDLQAFGVLAPQMALGAAEAELQVLLDASRTADAPPLRLQVLRFARAFTPEGFGLFLLVAQALLLAILTVAAANVANLVLVRTSARAGELAVRQALGASRAGIVTQLFMEVLLLGAAAAALAVAVSHRVVAWVDGLLADEAPMWVDIRIAPEVIVYAVLLALFATAVASLTPAQRGTSGGLDRSLRQGSAAVAGGGFGRLSSALVLAEIALSIALLSGAAVLGRGLLGYGSTQLDLPESEILTASLYLPPPPGGDLDLAIGRSLVSELEAQPEFHRAGLAMDLPGKSDSSLYDLEIERGDGQATPLVARVAYPGLGLFDSLGMTPLQGRLLEPGDHLPDASSVAVVNQAFVDEFVSSGSPLGLRIRYAPEPGREPAAWKQVVGVVGDLDMSPGRPGQEPGVYVPVRDSNFYFVTARFQGEPGAAEQALRRVVADHDARIIVSYVQTLEQAGWEARTLLRSVSLGLAALGLMALALSVAGTYAILAFTVQRRTREIGVRVALGADPVAILRAILGATGRRLAVGGALGVGLALLLARATVILPLELPGLAGGDLALVCAAMIGAGLAASWLPARRAARVDPVEALRAD